MMGKNTWETLGGDLEGTVCVVLSQTIQADGPIFFLGLRQAIGWAAEAHPSKPVWLVGGRRIFEEGLTYADFIDLTYVDEEVGDYDGIVKFPLIDVRSWHAGPWLPHEYDHTLRRRVFTRRR